MDFLPHRYLNTLLVYYRNKCRERVTIHFFTSLFEIFSIFWFITALFRNFQPSSVIYGRKFSL